MKDMPERYRLRLDALADCVARRAEDVQYLDDFSYSGQSGSTVMSYLKKAIEARTAGSRALRYAPVKTAEWAARCGSSGNHLYVVRGSAVGTSPMYIRAHRSKGPYCGMNGLVLDVYAPETVDALMGKGR